MATVSENVVEKLVGFSTEVPTTSEMRANFMKHAEKDEAGEFFLSENNFVRVIAPESEDYRKIKREQYALLFQVADRRRTGRVTLADWTFFENLLMKPDAEWQIAFRLFDVRGQGRIAFNDFKTLYDANKSTTLPFDWNSEWASLYTGGRNKRHDLTYYQFAQLLRGLQGERVRQAFQHFDKNGDGYIEPEEFQQIIISTAGHKLSDHLLDNLHTLCNVSNESMISYATVRAFQNMIQSMEQVEQIIRVAASQSPDGQITREDFLNACARSRRFTRFTPSEVDILFHFAGMDSPSKRLSLSQFARVLDSSWTTTDRFEAGLEVSSTAATGSTNFGRQALESAHHFLLGSIAGAFGAFMVYPIDLVKTRMQNQRGTVGNLLYKNSFDCASKVLKNEGVRGFYSGVLPQMIGVAPEKAIKLTVNDLVRGRLTDKDTGKIWWGSEVIAGGTAGGCQVVFTNPLEIVKIRLQVQGELAKQDAATPKRSALWIVRNLGLKGLYKGATACLARDIPFSAIYFPAYSHLKSDLFGESPTKKLGVLQLLSAGAIAGMPAAYLTTPFDVIKTRLQVEARKGDQTYTSLRNAAKTIYQQEGFKAFFKGGPARIFRSSPQFGFTLAGYEVLQGAFPLSGHHEEAEKGPFKPIPLPENAAPLPYIRSRNALKILMDLDEGFGIPKQPRGPSWITPKV